MASPRFFFQLPAGLLVCCLGQACITTPASETGWSGRAREREPGSCGATAADAMIEDAEDGDTRVLQRQGRGGYWFSFVDSSGSTIEAAQGSAKMPSPGHDSRHAAHMSGRTASSGDSIYAGMGLSLAEPRGKYDASRYSGVSFWAKGPGHVRLEIPDGYTAPEGRKCKDCYNDFGIDLALAAGWQRYTVPFEWLSQRQGWGDPRAEIERAELYAIEWQFGTPARDFDVWIDDVTFTCEGGAVRRLVVVASVASLCAACGGNDDEPRPEAGGQCGAIELTGEDDPGSGPIDCSALEGYEVQLIDDFETGAATGWYINNDRTALQLPAPDTDPVPGQRIPGGRCTEAPGLGSDYAIHIVSGNLAEFGAVFGRNMRRRLDADPCPVTPCLARTPPPPSVGPCGVGQATPGQQEATTECTTGADASDWEGVVLWARKGPASSSGVRIQVSDPTTDDSNQACVCNPFTNQNDTSDGCDKFGTYVNVDHTWRAYFVPFSGMQQGGWGLASPALDTSGLFSVTVQLGRGAWDVWIDDIGFYRRQP